MPPLGPWWATREQPLADLVRDPQGAPPELHGGGAKTGSVIAPPGRTAHAQPCRDLAAGDQRLADQRHASPEPGGLFLVPAERSLSQSHCTRTQPRPLKSPDTAVDVPTSTPRGSPSMDSPVPTCRSRESEEPGASIRGLAGPSSSVGTQQIGRFRSYRVPAQGHGRSLQTGMVRTRGCRGADAFPLCKHTTKVRSRGC